jgi:putative RNA 2'-phosphotransferase
LKQEQKKLESTSKFLSLILRHAPDTIGLTLDPQGWADIATLLQLADKHGKPIAPAELREIVDTSDKKRFAISDDGLSIRASQGHSVAAVDLGLPAVAPPPLLYHGTTLRYLDSIQREGLLARSRNHVHLSSVRETAVEVGKRHGPPHVLTVKSGTMHEQGYQFYLSANGVWLTAQVPAAFIEF